VSLTQQLNHNTIWVMRVSQRRHTRLQLKSGVFQSGPVP